MTEIKHLKGSEFRTAIAGKLALVDFFATWCGPCRLQAGALESVAKEASPDLLIAKIDVDESPELAAEFQIFSIPTIAIFKNGEQVYMKPGAHDKDSILALIKQFSH